MNIAVTILLALASISAMITALGVLWSRDPYQRLHFLAPVATTGVVCVAVAILVRESFNQAGIKALIAASVLFVMNPVLAHATMRAMRVHEHGRWEEEEPEDDG